MQGHIDIAGTGRDAVVDQVRNRDHFRALAVADGRAALYGYDPNKDRYDPDNRKALTKAILSPQGFFQSGPSSVGDGYRPSYGTYPWFVQQTQILARRLGISPNAPQAVVWYAIGGGV